MVFVVDLSSFFVAFTQPATGEEIGLSEDDLIAIEHQCDNGWWIGTNKNTKKRVL